MKFILIINAIIMHIAIQSKGGFMMRKFNEEEANRALENAKASLAVEGMYLPENEQQLIKMKLTGQITESQFKKMALELAKVVSI